MIALFVSLSVFTATPTGSATIPLEQLLELHAQKPAAATPSPPPLDAAVTRAEVTGRVSQDALALDLGFEVEVLAEGRWTQVTLCELPPEVYLGQLPQLEDATVAAHGGRLLFVSRKAGRHAFGLKLTVRAAGKDALRRAALQLGPAVPPAQVSLQVDPERFALLEPVPTSQGELQALFPDKGLVRAGWRSIVPEAAKAAAPVVRPPLEPRIPLATAVWVSTLEGKATLRVSYTLQLDREQPLELELPEGVRLERATLDDAHLPAKVDERSVRLRVSPSRPGETQAVLELVLAQDLGTFHLSGVLPLRLPRASWPIAEVRARTHLPHVFNYQRRGGSLEERVSDEAPETALPGKVLHFRQFLVSASAPTLELRYSVDIARGYFR
jgi:hypothetical protein